MHIDSYRFGQIVINGSTYTNDVLILPDSILPDWWRSQGHRLDADDLQPLLDERPDLLIIGCGASGMMKVPSETIETLKQYGIQIETLNTDQAVNRFNQLNQQGRRPTAALHLTC